MIYWHIQMNQPHGRHKIKIPSVEMLKEVKPVIGTGDWEHLQCDYFKATHPDGLKIGDIVMVHEGTTPIAICEVLSEYFSDIELEGKHKNKLFRYVKVLEFYKEKEEFKDSQGALKRLINVNTPSYKFIDSWYNKVKKKMSNKKVVDLLKYKKQIILQGPPGTGKTRLAKQIAEQLTSRVINQDTRVLTPHLINEKLKIGQKIANASGKEGFYEIVEIGEEEIGLQSEKSKVWKPKYDKIIDKYNDLIQNRKLSNKNNLDPYEIAIAQYLYKNLNYLEGKSKSNYTIAQFHPSYTYEDFVRGIVTETVNEKIEYKNINKVLGELANDAHKNWIDSQKENPVINKELLLEDVFNQFVEYVIDELEQGIIPLTESVSVVSVDKDAFRYKGNNGGWIENGNRMLFKDIKQAFLDDNIERQDLKKNTNLSGLAFHHASYYVRVLNLFQDFVKEKKIDFSVADTSQKVKLKEFVLIIDEINRANLSSVLGELIYALEYRGEKVESMYEVDGEKSIVLPPNLYIIGTMNTADRSVGHIDYAIRRRFAFVDVLPDVEAITLEKGKKVFSKVAELFSETYLTPEFKVKQVQLGHSYFIAKDDAELTIKFEYEVLPILEEYINDGILKVTAIDKINTIKKEEFGM